MGVCVSLFLLLIYANVARFQSASYYEIFSGAIISQIAVTDQVLAFAEDDHMNLTVVWRPFSKAPLVCRMPYRGLTRNTGLGRIEGIYSLLINRNPANDTHVVAFMGITNHDALQWGFLQVFADICTLYPSLEVEGKTINFFRLGSIGSFAFDPRGEQACAILIEITICFEVLFEHGRRYKHEQLWENVLFFHSRALIFTEDQRLFCVAFRRSPNSSHSEPYLYVASFAN